MAERESELSREDLRAIYVRSGPKEKELMKQLVRSSDPRQGVVLAEILHYFKGAKLI